MQQQVKKPQNFFGTPTSTKQSYPDNKSLSSLINKCEEIISVFADKDLTPEIRKQKENHGSLQVLQTLLEVVYELVVKYADNFHQFNRLENMLQKQQNLNRTLIKKQLEYQQEHKILVEELCGQRNMCAKLNEHITKLNEEVKDKDLTILHVKNELKACQKQKKILDDNKCSLNDEHQVMSYVFKDMNAEKTTNVLRLGHKRRNSEDLNRKIAKNEVKKKQKPKKDMRLN